MKSIENLLRHLDEIQKFSMVHSLDRLQKGLIIEQLDIGLMGYTATAFPMQEILKIFGKDAESKKCIKKILSTIIPNCNGTYSLKQVIELFIQEEVKKRVANELAPQDATFDFGD